MNVVIYSRVSSQSARQSTERQIVRKRNQTVDLCRLVDQSRQLAQRRIKHRANFIAMNADQPDRELGLL